MSTIEVLVTNGDTDLSRVHINHGADLSMDSLVRCVAVPDDACVAEAAKNTLAQGGRERSRERG